MSQLQWERLGNGYARTACRKYQMSITSRKGAARYICIFVTGLPNEPFRNIGQAFGPEAAKAICQRHNDEQQQGAAA